VRAGSSGSRRVGYVIAVLVNTVLLFLLNVSPGWAAVPFLTATFTQVLPWINLSLAVSVVANVLYVAFDQRWFIAGCQIVLSAIALIVAMQLLRVFPFDFSAYQFDWQQVTRISLSIGVLGSAVSVLVSCGQLARAVPPPQQRPAPDPGGLEAGERIVADG
jgi:hypothetical protein